MKVIPYEKRAEFEADFTLEKVAIDSWVLENFDKNKLMAVININFSYPIQISQGQLQDKLEVNFISTEFSKILLPSDRQKQINLPRLIEPTNSNM